MNHTHPAKALKYCPFCGSNQFVWDNKKAHHCKSCLHRLYTNEAGAVVALIENNKKEILFTRRKFDPAKGKLDLPGGFIDLGETAEHAVVREVKEEVNLDVESIEFFGTFPNTYTFCDFTYFTIDIVFRCKVNDFSPIKADDDVDSYRFINPKNVSINEIGLDSIKNIIRLLKS